MLTKHFVVASYNDCVSLCQAVKNCPLRKVIPYQLSSWTWSIEQATSLRTSSMWLYSYFWCGLCVSLGHWATFPSFHEGRGHQPAEGWKANDPVYSSSAHICLCNPMKLKNLEGTKMLHFLFSYPMMPHVCLLHSLLYISDSPVSLHLNRLWWVSFC